MAIESCFYHCAKTYKTKGHRSSSGVRNNPERFGDFDRYKCMGIISTENYPRGATGYRPVYTSQPHVIEDHVMLGYKSVEIAGPKGQPVSMTLQPLSDPARVNDPNGIKRRVQQGHKMNQTSFDSNTISV